MVEQRRKGTRRTARLGSERPARSARTRRTAAHGPRTVIPSNRWRPMRRVTPEAAKEETAGTGWLFQD